MVALAAMGAGLAYRRSGSEAATALVARSPLEVALPDDIYVALRPAAQGVYTSRAAFEDALQIRGLRQDRTIQAIQDPRVRAGLDAASEARATVCIERGHLVVETQSPIEASAHQALADQLARDFDAAWRIPWSGAAHALGLTWSGPHLSGVVDEIPITASEIATSGGWRVELRGRLEPALPLTLKIARGSGGLPSGDLMLDAAFRIEAKDAEQARALLGRDGVRALLLELIHPDPRSRVTEDGIFVSIPHWIPDDELQRSIRMVTHLARCLRDEPSG